NSQCFFPVRCLITSNSQRGTLCFLTDGNPLPSSDDTTSGAISTLPSRLRQPLDETFPAYVREALAPLLAGVDGKACAVHLDATHEAALLVVAPDAQRLDAQRRHGRVLQV